MNIFNLFFKSSTSTKKQVSVTTKNNILNAWNSVDIALKSKTPSQLRQALITADKCLDNALRDVVAGEKMADRLKNSKSKFDYKTYDNIWKAHKIRNNLVHEAGFEPSYVTLINSIKDLQNGLTKLGIKTN